MFEKIEGMDTHTSKCVAIGKCFGGEYCDPFPLIEALAMALCFAIIIISNKIYKSCKKPKAEPADERNILF